MRVAALLALAASAACADRAAPTPRAAAAAAPATVVRIDRGDLPLPGLAAADRRRFDEGDALFEATFRAADGLGPLFIRASCNACHRSDGRGPGQVGRFALSAAGGAPAPDALPYGTVERPYTAAGARAGIKAPPDRADVRVTYRLPPPVFGRGYVEAVADEELLRLEREARTRTNGIGGRIHWVRYESEANAEARVHRLTRGDRAIGRFGLKARVATLDEFTADALQGDMGLTSPLRPRELPNPDGLDDDDKPGVDVALDEVNAMADYMRLLALPPRREQTPAGSALFAAAGCATCHVPRLRTRQDYPIAALAGIEAPIYSDLLLHDMGEGLADGVRDGDASGREWKTPPLIGLRFQSALLHDGRATTVEAAIAAHEGPGSEANASIALYRALSDADRATLVTFVSGL